MIYKLKGIGPSTVPWGFPNDITFFTEFSKRVSLSQTSTSCQWITVSNAFSKYLLLYPSNKICKHSFFSTVKNNLMDNYFENLLFRPSNSAFIFSKHVLYDYFRTILDCGKWRAAWYFVGKFHGYKNLTNWYYYTGPQKCFLGTYAYLPTHQ